MNDSIIFRWSSLYRITIYDGFFDLKYESQDGIHLYIIGDKGYVHLPEFMIPLRQSANIEHTFLEALYNIHISK